MILFDLLIVRYIAQPQVGGNCRHVALDNSILLMEMVNLPIDFV